MAIPLPERLFELIENLDMLESRKVIVWCANCIVPTSPSPSRDAVDAAGAYVNGEIDYKSMRSKHDGAIHAYSKSHTEFYPWKHELHPTDAMNAAMLAKLCTVADAHLRIALEDAIHALHSVFPFDEQWLAIEEEVKNVINVSQRT